MTGLPIDQCRHCHSPVVWAYLDDPDTQGPIALDPTQTTVGTARQVGTATPYGVTRPVVRIVDGPDLFGTLHYHPHQCAQEPAA